MLNRIRIALRDLLTTQAEREALRANAERDERAAIRKIARQQRAYILTIDGVDTPPIHFTKALPILKEAAAAGKTVSFRFTVMP